MGARTEPQTAVRGHLAGAGALRVVRSSPVCAETPLERQRGLLTPNHLFYLRNNFPYPGSWPGLRVETAVRAPASLNLADLQQFSPKRLVATVECAGNGRSTLNPRVAGEQWGLGAVSTAEWSGVPLTELLAGLGLSSSGLEVAFAGADGFVRSLPIETAMHPDTLLATGMNGSPLPLEHGGPLRLLVPGWYGMASVKWLVGISMLIEPFVGHFQVERYVIGQSPVREMSVRGIITQPEPGSHVTGRTIPVAGFSWTGRGQIVRVELSDDLGDRWTEGKLVDAAPPYGWTRWEWSWHPRRTGPAVLLVRATDSTGRTQPLEPQWDPLGYCNNASAPHHLTVAGFSKEVVSEDVEPGNR